MEWIGIDRNENADGVTITYKGLGTNMLIQSRKRKIPHSGRDGFWWSTSFVLIDNGKEVVTKRSLKDAKKFAEEYRFKEAKKLLRPCSNCGGAWTLAYKNGLVSVKCVNCGRHTSYEWTEVEAFEKWGEING